MEETMKEARGVGLAAPQVGVNERLVLITLKNETLLPMINPVITAYSEHMSIAEEGCLSLPEIWIKIKRPSDVIVSFTTAKGEKRQLKFTGLESREAQHEIDHLDGILLTDFVIENHLKNQTLTKNK